MELDFFNSGTAFFFSCFKRTPLHHEKNPDSTYKSAEDLFMVGSIFDLVDNFYCGCSRFYPRDNTLCIVKLAYQPWIQAPTAHEQSTVWPPRPTGR